MAELVRQATDEEDGLRRYTCSKCGDSFEQAIPATGHDWGAWHEVESPACDRFGLEQRRCTSCGATEEREVAQLSPTGEHSWVQASRIEPTCEQAGEVRSVCEVCGEESAEELPALGHDWGPWRRVRAAAPGAEGLERSVCAHDSSHVRQRAIPALPAEAERPDKPSEATAASSAESKLPAPARGEEAETVAVADPWAPNALDAGLLAADVLALVAFALIAAPLLHARRWIAAHRREARATAPTARASQGGGRVL